LEFLFKMKFLKNIVVLIFFLLAVNSLQAQFFSFDLWKLKKEWGIIDFEKANTARFSPYMLWSQKRTILYMNLARQDGRKFLDLVANPYFEKHPDLKRHLYPASQLSRAKDLSMLYPSFRLWCAAFPHAIVSGLVGMEGHQGMDFRMGLFLNIGMTGENCSYGYFRGLNVALQLMNSPPHCSNILEDEFSRIAVAKMPHIKYGWNAVNTFSGPKYSDLVFRDHCTSKSMQVNVSGLTDFSHFIVDLTIGQRKNNNVNSARWAIGSEFFPFKDELLLGPKLHWASELYYGAIGANAMVYLMGDEYFPVIRPEISARFPFNIKKGYMDFLDLEKSGSSIGISYGYNFLLQKNKTLPVGNHVVSITYSKNFLFRGENIQNEKRRR